MRDLNMWGSSFKNENLSKKPLKTNKLNSFNFIKSSLSSAFQKTAQLSSSQHYDASKELESFLLLTEARALKTEIENLQIAEISSFEGYKIHQAHKKIQQLDSNESISVDIVPQIVQDLKRLMQEIHNLRKANISKNDFIKAASV